MPNRLRRWGLIAAALTAAALSTIPTSATERTTMIEQLRIYEIFEGNKEAFHARFRDHAARTRQAAGRLARPGAGDRRGRPPGVDDRHA